MNESKSIEAIDKTNLTHIGLLSFVTHVPEEIKNLLEIKT